MEAMLIVLGVLVLGLAGAAGWLLVQRGVLGAKVAGADAQRDAIAREAEGLRTEVLRLSADRDAARATVTEMTARAAELRARVEQIETERRRSDEQLKTMKDEFSSVFKALAGDTLRSNNEVFLKLASERLGAVKTDAAAEMDKRREAVEQLVRPIQERLKETGEKLGALAEQTRGVKDAGEGLRAETLRLTRALSRPEVRGRYGELQLRRVAELAGMSAYCDFAEQSSQRDSEGRLLRPDMVVQLPNARVLAVDAKTNTDAYLQACNEADGPAREDCLERFARHVAEQVTSLANKRYWSQFDGSPDFVVMFIPGDQFLDAALSRRNDLLERAAEQNVILASPSTLIGLLRAVAVGWREKKIADQAMELFELGRELHDRAATAFKKMADLGRALDSAVGRYNEFVGSYESRLEPTLRRFEDAGVRSGKELPEIRTVDVQSRKPAHTLENLQ